MYNYKSSNFKYKYNSFTIKLMKNILSQRYIMFECLVSYHTLTTCQAFFNIKIKQTKCKYGPIKNNLNIFHIN